MSEEEKPEGAAAVADPTNASVGDPAEEPTPDPAAEPAPDAEKPEGESEEKPPEEEAPASAFDKLFEGLTDPDDIEAAIERAREKLPEDRRQPKVDTAITEAQNAALTEQRRTATKRENETKRDSALKRLNGHLKEVRQRITADDPSDPRIATLPDDYDADLLSTAIEEITQAEVALADHEARDLLTAAISSRLEKHGGALSNERFREIAASVADNKVEHGIIGAYLDELGDRRYQTGLAEGEAKAQSRDEQWRKAEVAAVRAELMRDREIEPDGGVNRTSSTPTANSVEEYMKLSREDRARLVAASGGK